MHILILTKKFPYPLKDGEAIAIFNNIKGFSKLGHKVTVLAINTLKHHFDITQLPDDVKQLADFYEVTLNTSPNYLSALTNLFSGQSYHVARFISEAYRDKLKELLASEQFDLIQCEGLFHGQYLETIREMSKAPVVMRSHNVESEIWLRMAENESNLFKMWYIGLQASRLKKYELAQLNRYDAIIPITEEDHKKLLAMGATVPMFTSPAGIDLERFNGYEGLTRMKNTLFFIGGLDWPPNQEGIKWFLEKVWPTVKKKYHTLEFHIAGRNMPEWLKNCKKDGVQPYGEVEDALEFMARREIMLVPLFSGSGMRIKIIEGMAMSKAIIATAIGAEGIQCENRVNLMIDNEISSFIESIALCIGNATFADTLGKNARKLVESQYDNDKFAAALMNFYTSQFGT